MFTLKDFKEWFFEAYVECLQKLYPKQVPALDNEDNEEGTEEPHI